MFTKLKKKIAEESAFSPRPGGATRITRSVSKESIASAGADSGDDIVRVEIEEKDALILQLQERVNLLEKTVEGSFSGDKALQEFLKKKDTLEMKLDETKQQLLEAKTLHSAYVAQMDSQVATLNRKLQETQELLQQKEIEFDCFKEESFLKVAALNRKLQETQDLLQQKETEFNCFKEESLLKISSLQEVIAALHEPLYVAVGQETNGEVGVGYIAHLQRKNQELEQQILEKNKTIKQLQQRMVELKKTLQKELKLKPETEVNDVQEKLNPESSLTVTCSSDLTDSRDINFEYLKHVVLKFMSAREAEAFHLIKAVSVLLNFSVEEENLLKETLEYKMSWFGSKPVPKGTVRPSISKLRTTWS